MRCEIMKCVRPGGVAHRAIKKLICPNLAEIFQAEFPEIIFVSSSPLSRWLTYLGRGTVKGGQVCCRTWGVRFFSREKMSGQQHSLLLTKGFFGLLKLKTLVALSWHLSSTELTFFDHFLVNKLSY